MVDINPKFICYISDKGYLKNIISSLLDSDSELKDLISTKNKTLKPIYVYESKMVSLVFQFLIFLLHILIIFYTLESFK